MRLPEQRKHPPIYSSTRNMCMVVLGGIQADASFELFLGQRQLTAHAIRVAQEHAGDDNMDRRPPLLRQVDELLRQRLMLIGLPTQMMEITKSDEDGKPLFRSASLLA